MFKKLIDKLKIKKEQLQEYATNIEDVENKPVEEQNDFEIIISSENNISKIVISDYISMSDYIEKMKSSEEFQVLEHICNCVLWNSSQQKVNKGTYYVISNANRLYNIFFTDKKLEIDERTKVELDEQTGQEIIEEKVITFYPQTNEYHYYGAKHDKTGDTFYTRYYNKNRSFSMGTLDLSTEETYAEISSVIYNLERLEGIESIIDIEQLKNQILDDLDRDLLQRKNTL